MLFLWSPLNILLILQERFSDTQLSTEAPTLYSSAHKQLMSILIIFYILFLAWYNYINKDKWTILHKYLKDFCEQILKNLY